MQVHMRITPEAFKFLDDFANARGIKMSAAVEIITRDYQRLLAESTRKEAGK